MDWALPGRTSISADELAERLARTCTIIREEVPESSAALLSRMVVVWANPASPGAPMTEGAPDER